MCRQSVIGVDFYVIQRSHLFSKHLFMRCILKIKGLAHGFDAGFKMYVFVFSDDLTIVLVITKV